MDSVRLAWILTHHFILSQTDKQRIIWAYKILFLDVLFPLNLRKVIFTDSDQIIRADFAELWNMDLQVSPKCYLCHLLLSMNGIFVIQSNYSMMLTVLNDATRLFIFKSSTICQVVHALAHAERAGGVSQTWRRSSSWPVSRCDWA